MAILVLPRTLDASVSALPKVTAPDAKRLSKLGIETIRDLLLALPFDWEAYGAPKQVAGLQAGQQATVVGTVKSVNAKVSRHRRIKLTEATIVDETGAGLRLVW